MVPGRHAGMYRIVQSITGSRGRRLVGHRAAGDAPPHTWSAPEISSRPEGRREIDGRHPSDSATQPDPRHRYSTTLARMLSPGLRARSQG